MKQFFLLPLCVLIASVSFCQINKSQWLIGGNGSFSSYKPSYPGSYKNNNFQINADLGYFIINKLAAGLRIGYFHNHETGYSSTGDYFNQTGRQINLAPFIRYYFLPKDKKYNLLADASYYNGWSKDKNLGGYSKGTSKGYTFSAGPAWFINPHTALELTLNYTHDNTYYTSSTFKINIGFQIHLDNLKNKSHNK